MPEINGKSVMLKNGRLMPLLGIGCWQSPAGEVEGAVEAALDCGYRHIDTAYNYLNEEAVGKGIQNWLKKSEAKREEIFVVTKGEHDEDMFPLTKPGGFSMDFGTDLIAIWKEMEKMVDAGLVKSIGVSNFSIKQMRKLNAISRIPLVVNQVEMHINYQQKELVEFCNTNNIVVTAYAPFGSPGRTLPVVMSDQKPLPQVLSNPVVTCISQKLNVSNAQILIKFLIQQGIVTIPKSVNPQRIKTNGDVFGFKLNDCEMEALKLLDKGEEGRSFNFFNHPGIREHPECPI